MGTEQTYMIRMEDENNLSTNEIILQTQPTINQAAIMAIMNNYRSDCIIRIKDIQINEIIGRTTTTLTNLIYYRITAHTAGEPLTAIAFDSNASLPSQVVAYKYPNTITTTGNVIRRQLSLYNNTMTTIAALVACDGSMKSGGLNLQHDYRALDSNMQPITLREGEGFAVQTGLAMHVNFPVEFKVQFTDGTNSFMITEVLTANSATQFFSIFNGVGSGVVLRIIRTSMKQINDVSILRSYTLEACSEVVDGTSITPTKFDIANNEPDSLLDFRKNCVVTQTNIGTPMGRNYKWSGDIVPWKRLSMPAFGTGVALASALITIGPKKFNVYNSKRNRPDSQIVLREGEGFCILSKSWSFFGRYEIIILFTIEDNGETASGGEHSYIF